MSRPHTKLNPAAPSFPSAEPQPTIPIKTPPTPPSEQPINEAEELDTLGDMLDTTDLPEWILVQEDERRRTACLRLSKTATRDEWAASIREFAGLTFPECNIGAKPDAQWKPLAVRQMPPALELNLTAHSVTFSRSFLEDELRGMLWSPGFFFIHPDNRPRGSKVTAYWLLEAEIDPFLPTAPGEHGAKLTPFFNATLSKPGAAPTEADYMDAPVFIAKKAGCEYQYFGHYSQTRYSDKLDYERITDGTIPPFVLNIWAKYLTQKHLPTWTRDALREHIWPKPTYTGTKLPLLRLATYDTNGSGTTASDDSETHKKRVIAEIQHHADDLHEWEIDSRLKLSMLKESDIHRLFHAADADEQPGLRLWLEYLECTSYESEFYERLVEIKHNEPLQRGHEERQRERMRQGWKWELVRKVAGSGHVIKVPQLCPPKASVPIARKDSLTSATQGIPFSKGVQVEQEDQQGPKRRGRTLRRLDSEETVRASTEEPQPERTPDCGGRSFQLKDGERVVKGKIEEVQMSLPQQQRKALPPHLRAKADRQRSTSAQTEFEIGTTMGIQHSAGTKTSHKHETAARNSSSAVKEAARAKDSKVVEKFHNNNNASAFTTGDLEAAREMAFGFTKAKPRKNHHASGWGFDAKDKHGW